MNDRSIFGWAVVATLALASCGKDNEGRPLTSSHDTKHEQQQPSSSRQKVTEPESQPPQTEQATTTSVALTRKRVWDEVLKLRGDSLTPDSWKAIKQRYWTPNLEQVVQRGGQAKTASVRSLLAVPRDKKPLIVQIATGRFVDITDATEQESLLALHALAMVTASSGGISMPTVFEDRLANADITRGDVVLFEVFNDAFVDVPRRETVSEAELNKWQGLARSPNGLLRLLALRNFRRVAPTPDQWLNFYRNYVAETDQSILEEVVDLAFQTARPEAARLLSDVRTRAAGTLPADFVAKLDRSVAWLEKLPAQ